MRKLSVIAVIAITFVFIAGCSGIQIKMPDLDRVVHTGPKLVGALIAENNPDYVDTILEYGDMLLAESEPMKFEAELDAGVAWLLTKYVNNVGIRILILDCLPQLEIAPDTILERVPTPEWMDKVKAIVKAFIEGVKIGAG